MAKKQRKRKTKAQWQKLVQQFESRPSTQSAEAFFKKHRITGGSLYAHRARFNAKPKSPRRAKFPRSSVSAKLEGLRSLNVLLKKLLGDKLVEEKIAALTLSE